MECANSQTLTIYLICFQAQDAFFKCVEADAPGHTTHMEVTAVGLLYPSHCKAIRENYEHLRWSSICYAAVSCICYAPAFLICYAVVSCICYAPAFLIASLPVHEFLNLHITCFEGKCSLHTKYRIRITNFSLLEPLLVRCFSPAILLCVNSLLCRVFSVLI
jgi:hypothetical protein